MSGSIFNAASMVTSGIGLVAFGFACFTVFQYRRDRSYENTLKGTDDSRKVEVIKALRDRLDLPLDKLTDEQTYQLALSELKGKQKSDIWRSIIILIALILAAAIAYGSIKPSTVDLTFRAIDSDGIAASSEREAKVTVHLPNGSRTEDFTKSGQAVIKGVSREYISTTQPVVTEIYYFDKNSTSMILTTDVMNIEMAHNYGTPEGLQNKRAANLLLLKLLIPYRIISAATQVKHLETDLTQYCDDAFLAKALQINLDQPISSLNIGALADIFDVLSENEPTVIPQPNETIGHILERYAVLYKSSVQLFVSADPRALDPKIRTTLQVLAQTQFVEITASGSSLSFPSHQLHAAITNGLCHAMEEVRDKGALNPYAVFYPG